MLELLLLGASSPFDASGFAALITALTSAVLGGLAYASGRRKDRQVVVEAPVVHEDDSPHMNEWQSLVAELQKELEIVRAERNECKRRLARYEGVTDDRERGSGTGTHRPRRRQD